MGLKSFLPDVGRRNEAARLAWLERSLREIPAGSRLLDAGAGEQKLRKLCGHLRYVAQDLAQYDGRGNSAGLHSGGVNYGKLDIVSDIASIPEPDSSFDAIMCTEVLEHVSDPGTAIREFARLLRPGGMLILTAPFASLTHMAPYHFSTGFNKYFYQTMLGNNGFDIVEIVANGNYFEYLAQELYRVRSISQRYCGRSLRVWDYGALFALVCLLRRCSRTDSGSSELLCHGYHVRALKKANR